MKICFHGTNKRNAERILKQGFKAGTWFADHLEDALEYGGKHIFQVAVEWYWKRTYNWQILSANHISKERIVSYEIYSKPKKVFENMKLRTKVFKINKKLPNPKIKI